MPDEYKSPRRRGYLMPADEEAVRKIGGKLREKYNEVVAEPIPDRFADLLNQLERNSSGQKENGK